MKNNKFKNKLKELIFDFGSDELHTPLSGYAIGSMSKKEILETLEHMLFYKEYN